MHGVQSHAADRVKGAASASGLSGFTRAGPAETRPQAAKMPMFAVTPTEVFDAMHHCMPNEAYP